jgi:hypothetical protein
MSSTIGEIVESMAESYNAVCDFYEEADKLLGDSKDQFMKGVEVADDVMRLLLEYGRERLAQDRANRQGPGQGEAERSRPRPVTRGLKSER